MQHLTLTLLCLVVVATATAETEKRIVGGKTAEHHSHPYIASIRDTAGEHRWQHRCGGSIISEGWILTAAHCVCRGRTTIPLEPDDIYVVVGAISRHGKGPANMYEQTIRVSQIITHENYSRTVPNKVLPNDIAVLKLRSHIEMNKNVDVVNLAPPHYPYSEHTSCVVSGWGWTNGSDHSSGANHLQDAEVTTISNTECKKFKWHFDKVDEGQICTFDFDKHLANPCKGDSGGPVMCGPNREFLTGVISWGDCIYIPDRPGVYARVSYYLDWIKENTGVEAYTPYELMKCKDNGLPSQNAYCHWYLWYLRWLRPRYRVI